jgi:hypothetical protein
MNQASEAVKKSKVDSKFAITIFVDTISPAHFIAILLGQFLPLCCADTK